MCAVYNLATHICACVCAVTCAHVFITHACTQYTRMYKNITQCITPLLLGNMRYVYSYTS